MSSLLTMKGKISISDFPTMVGTIGNLDKSVQYYHMLEEQLRLYREELEKILNRIDGVDDITKFKAVNYEGSFKYDLPAIHLLIFTIHCKYYYHSLEMCPYGL